MNRKKYIIIAAAGSGIRMKISKPKQFLEINGKPVLRWTLEKFMNTVPDAGYIITLPKDKIEYWKNYCTCNADTFRVGQTLIPGGITRFHTIKNAMKNIPANSIVAIHDGVRPLVSERLIKNMFDIMETEKIQSLVPIVPIVDSLVRSESATAPGPVYDGGNIFSADRSHLFCVQTPQIFDGNILKEAYEQPYDESLTDDASVVRKAGGKVNYCDGEKYNIKLTTEEDLNIFRYILKED